MSAVSGFGKYFSFLVRRERMMSPVWITCVAGTAILFTGMYPGLFPDRQAMLAMAATMNAPAMTALMGPVYGLEAISSAIIMAQECLIWYALIVAVMNIFFISRHTRSDEELGRHELFRALPVGRLTGAVSALFGAFLLNLMISLLIASGILWLNIDGTTIPGAFAYALSIGTQGFLFAALTLLAAQLFSTSRGVTGSVFAALGIFYIIRAYGDMSGSGLSVISPIGLGLRVSAFYEDSFVPVAILLIEATVIGVAALAVCAGRDLGEGVIPARKGRAHASRFLRGEFGLAWRLSRGVLFAWGAAALAIGVTYGSVIGEIDTFISGNELYEQILEASGSGNSMADNYTAMVFSVGSLLASVPVINLVNKIRSEEKHGRLEQIFAKAVPREKTLLSYIVLAFIESFVFLILMALGFFIPAQSTGGEGLTALMEAALSYLPALWLMLGLCVLLIGLLPKLTSLVWAVFAYSFAMLYFGRLLDLPEWTWKLSPFGSIPQLPVQKFTAAPLIILTVLAAAFTAAGVMGFRRRDVG